MEASAPRQNIIEVQWQQMLQSQVQLRRQEVLTVNVSRTCSDKGSKKTNIVIVCPNQQTMFVLYNPYTIEVDHRNRNCYNCGTFGHLAKNYRNRGVRNRIEKERRPEYRDQNSKRIAEE